MTMMTLSLGSVRGACLLLGWCSVAFSLHCKWLQPGQERLSKVILLNFQRLGDGEMFPTQCMESAFPPDIDFIYNTTEVETAVLTLREVTQRINRFYSNPRPLLGYNRLRLEHFLAALEQRTNDLRDCIPMNGLNATLHSEASEAIEGYFRKLDDIASEKDNSVCARNIIRIEVGRQLRHTARLTTNIRNILRTSLFP
ncbi:interferon alpha-A-like [Ambystoma mexicanum]|uniref:interferon alpha-A-like n=1 Tax=Ambystoma mexicanum TaxID=8296 RepID=UPI0037E88916